jgi:mRNA-degrading endonuclease RelE of RelBE toxin-antitoxin system
MTWSILWGAPAERALRAMPWRDAAHVAAAVLRFAETGTGASRLHTDSQLTRRLRVDGYRVLMVLDPVAKWVWVVMIYRADR